MKYGKRKGSRIKGDPSVIGKELTRIKRSNKGKLSADAVLNAARDPASPLHSEFEWNKAKAARGFNLWQARMLIADLEIEIGEERTIRAFVHVERDNYQSTADALSDDEMREIVITRLQAEAEDWADRAALYEEFADAVAAVKRSKTRKRKRKRAS